MAPPATCATGSLIDATSGTRRFCHNCKRAKNHELRTTLWEGLAHLAARPQRSPALAPIGAAHTPAVGATSRLEQLCLPVARPAVGCKWLRGSQHHRSTARDVAPRAED